LASDRLRVVALDQREGDGEMPAIQAAQGELRL
jgi:hypothetical protein